MAYCTISELELTFGTANILHWSDVDEVGARNDEKINDCIEHAENDINEYMYEQFETPFADMPNTPLSINKVCRMISGVHLYIMRGIRDSETDEHMSSIKEKAYKILEKYLNGRVMLDRNNERVERLGHKVPINTNDPRFNGKTRFDSGQAFANICS